ncbi:hypothetical protein J2W46_006823 [Paraburkholderia strydomiana]|nr:hypothetical protein [Paraburkholderia strydomiana]
MRRHGRFCRSNAFAERHDDGMDYVPTNRWVLFGHHFAAIAGAGPLVCPVLAAQMGYLVPSHARSLQVLVVDDNENAADALTIYL